MNIKDITNFEEILKKKYGKKGELNRDKYEARALAFRVGEMLREARKDAKLTQEQLANRVGTKKTYTLKSREEKEIFSCQLFNN